MYKHIKSLATLLFSMLILSSCAYFPKFSGMFEGKEPKISRDSFHGYYKVGEPYQIDGIWYHPREEDDYEEVGMASWYGPEFNGKKTANGDTFDQNALTAAHRTLPLPSMIRVTNLDNDKTIILMVNDRGPFSRGRILDVSKRAAEILGFHNKGVEKVKVEFLKGQTARLLGDLPDSKVAYKVNRKFPLAADELRQDYASDSVNAGFMSSADVAGSALQGSAPISTMPVQMAYNTGGTASDMMINKMRVVKGKISDINIDLNESSKPIPLEKPLMAKSVDVSKNTVKPEITATPEADIAAKAEVAVQPEKVAAAEPVVSATEKAAEVVPGAAEAPAAVPAKEGMEQAAVPVETVAATQPSSVAVAEGKSLQESAEQLLENIYIQAGTFGVKENADRAEKILKVIGKVSINTIDIGSRTLYRVRLGPMEDEQIANVALKKVISMGHPDAIIVNN